MSEDFESEALTRFFRLFAILPSRVPNTPEEFAVDVAVEDLDFVRSLYVADNWGLLPLFLVPCSGSDP